MDRRNQGGGYLTMPRLSVIIASVNGLTCIDDCLSSLEDETREFDCEVVVANRCQDGTAQHIAQTFPWVKVLSFSRQLSVWELRGRALAEATGDVIVVTEDHCIVPKGWVSEILKAHQLGYMVVGGAVENGTTDRIIDWAAFLCEYSSAMLPIPAGEVDSIPGNNAAYKREVFKLADCTTERTLWDWFFHEELKKKGIRFLSVPSIVVHHTKTFGFFHFLTQRFHYSRSFAGVRRSLISPSSRIGYILASPLLPLMMASRVARNVLIDKRRCYRQFVLAIPSLSAFWMSYAIGEFVGYLLGPGKSLNRIE